MLLTKRQYATQVAAKQRRVEDLRHELNLCMLLTKPLYATQVAAEQRRVEDLRHDVVEGKQRE